MENKLMQNIAITVLLVVVCVIFPIVLIDGVMDNVRKSRAYDVEVQYNQIRPRGYRANKTIRYKESCCCHWEGIYGTRDKASTKDNNDISTTNVTAGPGHSGIRVVGNGADVFQISSQGSWSFTEIQR